MILAFNVRPVGDARPIAEREGVEIRSYAVIYRAIEELRAAMQGDARARRGRDAARPGRGAPALQGLADRHRSPARFVTEGKVTRGAAGALVRDGTVIYDTTIAEPAPLQRRRQGGRVRLRVRDRAHQLPGRQGGRRARDL